MEGKHLPSLYRLGRKKLGKLEKGVIFSVAGAWFKMNGLGMGRRHKSSIFVHSRIHLAHIYYLLHVRYCS